MVTDEERDYMYRAYARDRHARINLGIRHRLAPLLRNDRRRIELMFALLFSLPGTPVIYYGDEIGMGDNIYLGDRDGVRTPMQWSADRNAGFSRANPQKLYLPVVIDPEYHYETVNVEAQQGNPSSLLWWVKRLITLRKTFRAFGRGSFRLLRPENPKVLAFVREYEDERVLVVANLSRFVQYVQLDLKEYAGVVPEEVLGRTRFPPITDEPYLLTLGPHAFIWFSLPVAADVAGGHRRATADGCRRAADAAGRAAACSSGFSRPTGTSSKYCFRSTSRRHRMLPTRSRITACRVLDVAPIKLDGIDDLLPDRPCRAARRDRRDDLAAAGVRSGRSDRPALDAARGGLVRRDRGARARRALRCAGSARLLPWLAPRDPDGPIAASRGRRDRGGARCKPGSAESAEERRGSAAVAASLGERFDTTRHVWRIITFSRRSIGSRRASTPTSKSGAT